MLKMTSPLTALRAVAAAFLACLTAGPGAFAQSSLGTISTSVPSGGEPRSLVRNGGSRAYTFNSQARTISIFNIASGTEAHIATRTIPSPFPDQFEALSAVISIGGTTPDHLYVTNQGSSQIFVFDVAPANDTSATVPPLATLNIPAGGGANNIVAFAADTVGGRVYAIDQANNRVLVIDDGVSPAFNAASPITGGGNIISPNSIALFGSTRAYVSNGNNTVTSFSLTPPVSGPWPTTNIPIPGPASSTATLGPVVCAPLQDHVCVLSSVAGPGSTLAIIHASVDIYNPPTDGYSVDLSAFRPFGNNNGQPPPMMIDDRAATSPGPGDSRVLILMQDTAGAPLVVHVDNSHETTNPTSGEPSVLGFSPLSAFIENFGNETDLFAMDPVNKRLAVRSGDNNFDVANTSFFSSPRASGTSSTNIPLVGTAVTANNNDHIRMAGGGGRFIVTLADTGGLRIVDSSNGNLVANLATTGLLSGIQADPLTGRVWVAQTGADGAEFFDGVTFARTAIGGIAPPFIEGPIMDPTTGAAGFARFVERTPGTPDIGFFAVKPDQTVVTIPLTLAEAAAQDGAAVDTVNHRLYLVFTPNTIKAYDFNPSSPTFGQYLFSGTISLMANYKINDLFISPQARVLYLTERPNPGISGNVFIHGINADTLAQTFAPVDTGVTGEVKPIIVDHALGRIYHPRVNNGVSPSAFVDVRSELTGALIGSASLPTPPSMGDSKIGMTPMLSASDLYLLDGNGNVMVMNMGGGSFSATTLGTFPNIDVNDSDDLIGSNFLASEINKRVYVIDDSIDSVRVLAADPSNLSTFQTFLSPVTAGIGPRRMAVNETNGRLYVINAGGDISVFGTSVTVGTLTYAVGSATPAAKNVFKGEAGVAMTQVALSADSAENINLRSFIITNDASATSGDPLTGVSSVRLFHDANNDGVLNSGDVQLGSSTSFTASPTGASFNGNPLLTIPASATRNLLIVYNFSGTVNLGDTFDAIVASGSSLNIGASSGVPVTEAGTFPIVGNPMTISPRTSWTASLPGGTTEAAYRMIGVPLNTGGTTASQIVSQVGGGTYDTTQLRIFAWDPFAQAYFEFGTSSPPPAKTTVTPGSQPSFSGFVDPGYDEGFWVILRNAQSITWTGTSTASAPSVTVYLEPGWNLVHGVYDEPVPMSSILVGVSSLNASSNTLTTQGGYYWNGSSYVLETGALQPGVAYWIQCLASSTCTMDVPRPTYATKANGGTGAAVSHASAPPPGAALPPPPPSQAPTTSSSGGHGGGGGCFLPGAVAAPLAPFALAGLAAALMAAIRRRRRD